MLLNTPSAYVQQKKARWGAFRAWDVGVLFPTFQLAFIDVGAIQSPRFDVSGVVQFDVMLTSGLCEIAINRLRLRRSQPRHEVRALRNLLW